MLDDWLISERFVRASGPGGQNVNKVATAVELRFDVGRSSLSADVKVRLRALAGSRMSDDDVLVIHSRAFRTQLRNREAARERLEQMVEQASLPPRPRRATRPTSGSKESRLKGKLRRSAIKRSRSAKTDD